MEETTAVRSDWDAEDRVRENHREADEVAEVTAERNEGMLVDARKIGAVWGKKKRERMSQS